MYHSDWEGLGVTRGTILDATTRQPISVIPTIQPTVTEPVKVDIARTVAPILRLAQAAREKALTEEAARRMQAGTVPMMTTMPVLYGPGGGGGGGAGGAIPFDPVPVEADYATQPVATAGFEFQPWMLALLAIPFILRRLR